MSGRQVEIIPRHRDWRRPDSVNVIGGTSADVNSIVGISAGAMIRAYPTSAGTASVYSSGSLLTLVNADIAAGAAAITGNTNARWSLWGAGAVTADTTQQALLPQTAVAIIVTSGTWTLEVCQ